MRDGDEVLCQNLVDMNKTSAETQMGYGSCSVSGCPCPAYKDTYGSQLCNNCGHKYTDHW